MSRRDGGWFAYDRNGRVRHSRSQRLRRVRRHLRFRFGTLNALGWAAVIGPGVALGLLVGLATSVPAAAALPAGALAAWSAVLVADRVRHPHDTRL
ncbi:MAG: hypothetical protein S0880_18045 [Actinomycetota bacterium]|nr:hypothetical protein [Actinomycetota bacterium]